MIQHLSTEFCLQRLLLRAGKSPFHVLSPSASVDDYPGGVFGGNMGNMIFSDAMHRILSRPGVDVVPNTYLGERQGITRPYLERINAEFDHFVVPLANAFRPTFLANLDRLTSTIRGLRIPVTITGVGIGGDIESLSNEEVKRAARRFMATVLDRSARVGVRGEITRKFLRDIGYGDAHVQVIGCPSLFRYGDDLQIKKADKRLAPDDVIAVNTSHEKGVVRAMDECVARHATRYPKLVYIAQDLRDLHLLLSGDNKNRAEPLAIHRDRLFYQENRMLAFVDSRTWIDFLATVRFSFGTRIHGNIAALVAGTPAVVLAWDLRTQEIADYHHIPCRAAAEAAAFDAAELHENADFSAFNKKHRERFATFTAFLHENGLPTIFDPRQANPSYDARLAAAPLPGPVQTVRGSRGANGVLKRFAVRWHRTSYHFTAPVPHVPETLPGKAGAAIARAVDRLRRYRG